MIKNFIDWLIEQRASDYIVKTPNDIEIIVGDQAILIDPDAEDWNKEQENLKEYQSILAKIKKAIYENDKDTLNDIIQKAKNTSLFSREPGTAWRKKREDSLSAVYSNADFDHWVSRYIVNKLEVFIAWKKINHK